MQRVKDTYQRGLEQDKVFYLEISGRPEGQRNR